MRKIISIVVFVLFLVAGVVAGFWEHSQEVPTIYEDTVAYTSAQEFYYQIESIPISEIKYVTVKNRSSKLPDNIQNDYVLLHYKIASEDTDIGKSLPFKHANNSLGLSIYGSICISIIGALIAFGGIWPQSKEAKS